MSVEHRDYGKCSKVSNTFLYLFSNKMWNIKDGIHKILVRIATGKTLIRLLLQKQSDLGLHCLPKPFLLMTSVQNFRTSTIESMRSHKRKATEVN